MAGASALSASAASLLPVRLPQSHALSASSPAEDDYGADFDEFAGSPRSHGSGVSDAVNSFAHNSFGGGVGGGALDFASAIIESTYVNFTADMESELDFEASTRVGQPLAMREFTIPNAFTEQTLTAVGGGDVGLLRQQLRGDTPEIHLRSATPNNFVRNEASTPQRYLIASRDASRSELLSQSAELRSSESLPVFGSPPLSAGQAFRKRIEARLAGPPRAGDDSQLSIINAINAGAAADVELRSGSGASHSILLAGGQNRAAASAIGSTRVNFAARTASNAAPKVVVLSSRDKPPPTFPKLPMYSPAVVRSLAGSGSAAASSAVLSRRVDAARAEAAAEADARIAVAREKANGVINNKEKVVKSLTRRLEVCLRSADVDAVKVREYDVLAARVVQLEAER